MSFDEEFIKAVSGDLKDNVNDIMLNNEGLIPQNAKEWVHEAIKTLKPDYYKNKDRCKDGECWKDVKHNYKISKLGSPQPFKNMKNKEINLELLLFTIISIIVFFKILKNITNK